jgi:hypothetical protein
MELPAAIVVSYWPLAHADSSRSTAVGRVGMQQVPQGDIVHTAAL